MHNRVLGLVSALLCVALLPSAAFAANCRPPCANVEASVKPTSIIPGPEDATTRGESFTQSMTTLDLRGNGSQEVKLNFGFQVGTQTYTSVFVNENGFVSFAAPQATALAFAAPGFQQVDSLTQLGAPVIAPFYADLLSTGETQSHLGNVVVQYGTADPYPNDGAYQASQFQDAVRITWYGLTTNGSDNSNQVFAQLLLTGDNKGTSSFGFAYGQPGHPGQAGDGSIAGFALGADAFQFTGPYTNGVPTYFEFDNGRFVGDLADGAVPEPATWVQLLLGFAVIGAALRRRQVARDRRSPWPSPCPAP